MLIYKIIFILMFICGVLSLTMSINFFYQLKFLNAVGMALLSMFIIYLSTFIYARGF
jgi:hypothetical protein